MSAVRVCYVVCSCGQRHTPGIRCACEPPSRWEVSNAAGVVVGEVLARHGFGAVAAVRRGELGARLALGAAFAVAPC